jgi:hypothetical protein
MDYLGRCLLELQQLMDLGSAVDQLRQRFRPSEPRPYSAEYDPENPFDDNVMECEDEYRPESPAFDRDVLRVKLSSRAYDPEDPMSEEPVVNLPYDPLSPPYDRSMPCYHCAYLSLPPASWM